MYLFALNTGNMVAYMNDTPPSSKMGNKMILCLRVRPVNNPKDEPIPITM